MGVSIDGLPRFGLWKVCGGVTVKGKRVVLTVN